MGKKLIALENIGSEPRMAWDKDITGTPASIIAADKKLFVATAEGGLYCFGQAFTPPTVPKEYAGKPVPLEAKSDLWNEKATEIVKTSGVKAGYGLVLGLKDGRLIEELLKRTELIVVGVDNDSAKVNALRRHFDNAGFYGARVELFVGAPFEFRFPPYIASLIVSEDPEAAGFSKNPDAAKLFNILRPYGGTLCLILPKEKRPEFEKWANAAKLEKAVLKFENGCSLLVREGALPGSAPWVQESCDAARTFCSQDELVKAPLGFLWYGDQNGFVQFHDYNGGVKPQVVDGRVFALQRFPKHFLLAYDAYTGRFLWKNELDRPARFSAQTDGIFLVVDGKCIVYAPDTGAVLKTFTLNATGETIAKDLRVEHDVIVVLCADLNDKELSGGTMLVCLDRKNGAELWRREAKDRFNNDAFAMGGGMLFGVDSIPMSKADKWKQRTANIKEIESTVFALEARTGKEVWSKKITYNYADGGIDDWVAYAANANMLLAGRMGIASALDAKTGKAMWENKRFVRVPLIVHDKTLIDFDGIIYDRATGDRISKTCGIGRYGCGYATGSRNLIMARALGGASYADIEQGKAYHLRNIRSGCSNSLIPADGLLNSPNYSFGCICNYAIQTSFAMIHMPEVAEWAGTVPIPMNPPRAKPATKPAPGNQN